MLGSVSALILVLGIVFACPVAVADVGDQYLPEIPDSGAKTGGTGSGSSETRSDEGAPGGEGSSGGKSEKKSESKKDSAGVAVSGTPGGGDGGPGTGAVIGLVVLALAMVGAVLWLVLRGNSALADAEQGSGGSGRSATTPNGEITGSSSDGKGGKR